MAVCKALRVLLAVCAVITFNEISSAGVTTAVSPTEYEQYMLELLNRARANPDAEVTRLSGETWGDNPLLVPATAYPASQTPDLNEGLPAGTISNTSKQPLAFNLSLVTASRNHVQHSLQADAWGHFEGPAPVPNNVCWTGDSPSDRAMAAGYGGGVSENTAVGVSTAAWSSTAAQIGAAAARHDNLFVDNNVVGRGHRTNAMAEGHTEVGIGYFLGTNYQGPFSSSWAHASFANYNFGSVASTLLTGVAFDDHDDDNFYTPDGTEALAGLTVQALVGGTVVGSTTTYASGGYSLDLAAGTYDIRFVDAVGRYYAAGSTTIGATNVKIDAVSPVFTAVPEPSAFLFLALIAVFGRFRSRLLAV